MLDTAHNSEGGIASSVRMWLKNPIISVTVGFCIGAACMFCFDCIYCSRESYREAIAKSYIKESLQVFPGGRVPNDMFDDAFDVAMQSARKQASIPPSETQPKENDPRLLQFEVQSWKPFFREVAFSQRLSFETTVKNGTNAAIKNFSFSITVKRKGRTVPLVEGESIYFFPDSGIEPGETITTDGTGYDIRIPPDAGLDDLEFDVSIESITFFDGERINTE